MKYSLLTPELKHQIRHSEKYLIDIDNQDEDMISDFSSLEENYPETERNLVE